VRIITWCIETNGARARKMNQIGKILVDLIMHATGRILIGGKAAGYRFLGKQVIFSFARARRRDNNGTSSASPSLFAILTN
jgi:hypothetical protein